MGCAMAVVWGLCCQGMQPGYDYWWWANSLRRQEAPTQRPKAADFERVLTNVLQAGPAVFELGLKEAAKLLPPTTSL